jgi:hypothetical protein
MPEPKRARAEAALDDVSDHLAVVLQRADELLAQWSAFGAAVRGQVEREAAAIGDAVAGAVDTAVARATASGIDHAITEQVGSRLTALTGEIARLEARARAAAGAVVAARMGDRRLLWGVIGGIVLANALLVAILLRPPAVVAVPAPAEPTKVEPASPAGAVGAAPAPAAAVGAALEAGAAAESAGAPQADAPSSNEPAAAAKAGVQYPEPRTAAKESAPRSESAAAANEGAHHPEPRPAATATRPVGAPAASAAPSPGGQPEHGASAQSLGGSVAGTRGTPSAKLPPRAAPMKK